MTTTARPELPPMPERIAKLPVDHRGYPVPFFAAWVDDDNRPLPRGQGKADHRVVFPGAQIDALRRRVCWICGGPLGAYKTFVIGPMCAVNRISAEPPMHLDCGDWSARACPFLTRPHARRRKAGMPDETAEVPGIMLERNPGVILVWTTRRFHLKATPTGYLCAFDDPTDLRWYAEGREATRDEIMESIESGLPHLRELAEQDGPRAIKELESDVQRALQLVA